MSSQSNTTLGLTPEQKESVEKAAAKMAGEHEEPVPQNQCVARLCRDYVEAEA